MKRGWFFLEPRLGYFGQRPINSINLLRSSGYFT